MPETLTRLRGCAGHGGVGRMLNKKRIPLLAKDLFQEGIRCHSPVSSTELVGRRSLVFQGVENLVIMLFDLYLWEDM